MWIGHQHDIEAHRQTRQVGALLQQRSGGARDALLLGTRDTGGGATVGVARAGAHFGNNQHPDITCDDIELAEPAPIVAQQDLAARPAEEIGGQILGAPPAQLPRRRRSRACSFRTGQDGFTAQPRAAAAARRRAAAPS